MEEIRYIHAADLHLDTPFRGLMRETMKGEQLAKVLHGATFTALERLTRLAISEKPDFLVLAGDIYNQEDYSVKAQLKLRDACERMGKAGIRVFIAHGNHDPLSSRLAAVHLPENVTVFPAEAPATHVFGRDGKPLALIHGMSHAADREPRNFARLFQRDRTYDCFQIGVLHCSVGSADVDRYAPCSLEDLLNSGLDAWALGHVHERKILSEQPFIAYPGNTQGLHINEQGARGCYIVNVSATGGSWRCQSSFVPLAPVQWQIVDVDVDGLEQHSEVEEKLNLELEKVIAESDPHLEGIVARVRLKGRTALRHELMKQQSQDNLLDLLGALERSRPSLWIKDMELDLSDIASMDEYLRRDDLLGETARVYQQLLSSAGELEELAVQATAPLFKSPRNRKFMAPLSPEELTDALTQAERICQDILEGR